MRTIITHLFFICFIYAHLYAQPLEAQGNYPLIPIQTPTYANYPTPENVLVVYKRNNYASESIMNYYVSRRLIPPVNVIKGPDQNPGLYIPDSQIYSTGTVVLDQGGEIIKNAGTCSESTIEVCDTTAWHLLCSVLHVQDTLRCYLV